MGFCDFTPYPVGIKQKDSIAPGETAQDLLFFVYTRVENDLKLILGCDVMGGKGDLVVTIPKGMIQQEIP